MERESNCVESIFQRYIVTKSKYDINAFFEGCDDYKYYICRITSNYGDKEINPIICECKSNVIDVEKMISKKTANNNDTVNLFFVDRDFDVNDKLPDSIYVTSSYSIENYYCTNAAIKRILTGVLRIDRKSSSDSSDLKKAYTKVIKERDMIIKDILDVNAWYSLQIKKSKTNDTAPKLGGIKYYKDIKGHSINEIKNKVKNHIVVTQKEISEEKKRLKKNPVKEIRGKYLAEAIKPILNDIIQDAGKKNSKYFSKKRKCSTNISDLLSDLSVYADTPKELIDYIRGR